MIARISSTVLLDELESQQVTLDRYANPNAYPSITLSPD